MSRRAATGAAWFAAGRTFQLLLGLTATIVIARVLGPQAWGMFAIAMLAASVAQLFAGAWLCECLVADGDPDDAAFDSVFWLNLLLALIACGLLVGPGSWAAARLGDGADQLARALGAAVFLGALWAVPGAVLMRRCAHERIVWADAGASVAAPLVGIAAALGGAGAWSLVAMEVVRALVRTVLAFAFSGWRPTRGPRLGALRRLARPALATLAVKALQTADRITPRLLVAALLGPAALALFTIAWRLYEQLQQLIIEPLSGVTIAESAVLRGRPDLLHTLLEKAIQLSSFVAYPAFVGLIVTAPIAIPLVYGSAWEGAVLPLQLIALIGLRSAVSAFNGGILRGWGRPDLQVRQVAFGFVALLLLAALLAPYGLAGIAAAMALRAFLVWPVGAVAVQKLTGFPARRQFTLAARSLAGALIMALAVSGAGALTASQPAWVRLALMIAVGLAVYAAAAWALAPRDLRSSLRERLSRVTGKATNAAASTPSR